MFKTTIVDYINGKDVYYDGVNHYIKTSTGARLTISYDKNKKYN